MKIYSLPDLPRIVGKGGKRGKFIQSIVTVYSNGIVNGAMTVLNWGFNSRQQKSAYPIIKCFFLNPSLEFFESDHGFFSSSC